MVSTGQCRRCQLERDKYHVKLEEKGRKRKNTAELSCNTQKSPHFSTLPIPFTDLFNNKSKDVWIISNNATLSIVGHACYPGSFTRPLHNAATTTSKSPHTHSTNRATDESTTDSTFGQLYTTTKHFLSFKAAPVASPPPTTEPDRERERGK
jgi:hypothetical protein